MARHRAIASRIRRPAAFPRPVEMLCHRVRGAGAIVAAIAAGLWARGICLRIQPSRQRKRRRLAPLLRSSAIGGDITVRLDKIERAIQASSRNAHQEPALVPPALGNRLTAAEAQTKLLGDQLAALNRRVDDIAAASQSAAKQADAAVVAAEAAERPRQERGHAKKRRNEGVQQSDIDALAEPRRGIGKRREGARR